MYNVLFLPDFKIWGGGYGSQLSEVQIDTSSLKKNHTKIVFTNTVVSFKKNDNGMVQFQQGIINNAANIISAYQISLL